MNGYSLMADSYKKAAEQGKTTKEQAEKHIRIYDFLASCDPDDICILFDSSAFNEVSKGYLQKAVKRLVDNGTIEEEQAASVRNEYRLLLSEMTAKEVSEG